MRTELASGAWIEHRPLQDLKAKDKDAVNAAVKMHLPLTADGEMDLSQGVTMGGIVQITSRNALLARVLTGWSYELPLPKFENSEVQDEDSIGEIPLDDFDEIEQMIAPYLAKIRRKADPKAVTTSASNGSSRASGAHGSRTA